ncbi:MAG: 4-hydroxy-tetrahydrodipicolinate reductase, partial [Caldimonas sp.]
MTDSAGRPGAAEPGQGLAAGNAPAAAAAALVPAGRLRIAVAGASGRMGRMLVEAVTASPDLQLSGALEVGASPAIGSDATAFLGRDSGVRIGADVAAGLAG